MDSRNVRRFALVLGGIALLFPLFLVSVSPVTQAVPSGDQVAFEQLMNPSDPWMKIAKDLTIHGLAKKGALKCIDGPGISVCLHPDTDPGMAEEILRNLPTYLGIGKEAYNKADRWFNTASGLTGSEGDPITLTWGFVPDGTTCDGSPSTLFADFNAAFGDTVWKTRIRNALSLWERSTGITYIEVPDDGATWPGATGLLGTRGDVRIAGRSIDGPSNVLAYNYYPDTGDMLLDTDDTAFYTISLYKHGRLRNVVAHEHGHGIGLGHSIPEECTKLMEAYACNPSSFVGPQDDDIRGGNRNYGDSYENNDGYTTATDLGDIVDTTFVEYLSIDRGTDEDWFLIGLAGGDLRVEVDPIGSTYQIGDEGGSTSEVSTDSISNPEFYLYDDTGTNLLTSATSAGLGETEILSGYTAPYSGDYYLRVRRTDGSGNYPQRYTLTVIRDVSTSVLAGESDAPARVALDLAVVPNPFNPQTSARFYAPQAGPYAVEIFDVSGRLARRVVGNTAGAGWTDVRWDGTDNSGAPVASGVYLMRVTSGGLTEVERAILVR